MTTNGVPFGRAVSLCVQAARDLHRVTAMEFDLQEFGLVVLGGGVGSMMRAVLAGRLTPRLSAAGAVFAINAGGSFAMGVAAGVLLATTSLFNPGPTPGWFTFLAIGMLGGFTTVSTFALQVWEVSQSGQGRKAGGLALGSLVLCPVLAALGMMLGLLPEFL